MKVDVEFKLIVDTYGPGASQAQSNRIFNELAQYLLQCIDHYGEMTGLMKDLTAKVEKWER